MKPEPTIMGLHSRGHDVLFLQQDLAFLGFEAPQHGVFDEATQAAVKKFQEQHYAQGGVTAKLRASLSELVTHRRTLLERGSSDDLEAEEYEIEGMTSNPIKDLPYHEASKTSRGGWIPDTIIIGYTGTVSPEHTYALLNVPNILAAHYIVWENATGRCVPEEDACWLGGYSSDSTLPLRSVVILVENMGYLSGSKEKGWTHGMFPTVPYDAQMYGQPVEDFAHPHAAYWQPFASSQIDAVKVLCRRLQEKWGITRVIGLADAIKGSMSPGPAFPLQELVEFIKETDNV